MFKRSVAAFQDFFDISPKQARASLTLLALSAVLLFTPFFYRRWILPVIDARSGTQSDTARLNQIVAALQREEAKKAADQPSKPHQYKTANTTRIVKLSPFNPNTASVDQLENLGIPAFLAKRIDKYRQRGGQFRKKQDLQRIYDFPQDLFAKLEPYIVLNAPIADDRQPTIVQPQASRAYPSLAKSQIATFDINTADTTTLIRLKGIGSKLSVRILRFRDALGGFHSTNQYNEIFGLDSLAIGELRKYAKIQTPVQKIAINTVTPESLNKHPYFRNKKLTYVLENYRSQHGPYRSADDLQATKVIDEETLAKILPYLEF